MKSYAVIARNALVAALLVLVAPAARAGSITGRMLDASGKPVAGAKVRWTVYRSEDEVLLDQTNAADPAVLGETATDAEGRFRVGLDKPGTSVSLRLAPAGLPTARFEGPFDSSEDIELGEIQAIGAQPVSGRVVDESGKPVAGARVLASASLILFDNDSRFFSETRTGADGTFLMADAPQGSRLVLARAPGYITVTRLQMEARPEEKITLRRGGSIRGVLTDSAGKPAAGVLVVSGETAAQTDAEGKFLLTGIAAGLHRLQAVWKEEFAARRDNVRVKDGEETAAPMKLARASAIAGTVIEEGSRRPVSGVRVAVYSQGGPGFARRRAERAGRTDARGRFRVGGLAGRPYTVEATKDGFLPASIAGVTAASASPGSASLALRRAASIAGRVTDEKGQAVAGAKVKITREMGVRRMIRGMSSNPASFLASQGVVTGPDGSFKLRGLAPERNLALEATKTGYATASRPGVTIKAGEALKDVALVLRRGLEAKSRVVDGKGEPVAGAQVRAARREEGFAGTRNIIRLAGLDQGDKPDAVSGADGTFVLKGLEEGQYTLAVTREGFAPKSVPSLEVKANAENVWPPISLTAGVSITGAVRGSGGQAVSGAQIMAIDMTNPGRPQDASSDPEGNFRLDGFMPERPILLNVNAPGYAPAQKNVTPPAEAIAVVLKSAGTVRGRVEDADTKRPVTDFSVARRGGGGPGGGIQIAMGGRGGDQTFQADDGSFELADVPPGKWTLRASAAGYRAADVSGVEVGEGETKEGVVFSLKRGGGLSGRVVDPRGAAVANAAVTWHPTETQGGGMGAAMARMMGGGGGGAATTTDADGRFSFDGLSEGRVTVTASHPDYLEASRDVDPSKEPAVDLALGTGAGISGTVVGRDGRSGVPGALVSMNEEGDAGAGFGMETTRTDGAGNFLFEHLRAGRFKLTASSSAGKSLPKDVVVADGQRMDGVLMEIATGSLLRGTVSGLPANRLGGVRIFGSAKDYNDNAVTDDSGNFTLRDAPAGVVRVQATTSFLSGKTTAKSVEVPEGAAEVPVQIVFEGSSRLSGRVTRGDRPLSGLFVNATPDPPSASAGRATGQTDEDGRYALEGLTDGNYQVNVAGQGVNYRKAFAVSGDSAGDIVLPPVSITGTVSEEGSGDPLEGVMVQAQAAQQGTSFSVKQARTDSNGHYFLDDLDSGNYKLSASKGGYQAKTQTITIGAESAESNIALQRSEGLTIHASDGLTGLPLKGLTAVAYAPGGTVAFRGTVNLDSTGRGEITSLGAGAYSLYLFSDGYSPRSFPSLQIPSPAVAVALTPGGRVEVRPAAPVSGRIVDSAGASYLLGPFRMDGRVAPSPPLVVWDNFAPGSYTLLVGSAGAETPYPFTVVEGRTTTLEIK